MDRAVRKIELENALRKLGVSKDKVVVIISDLAAFGDIEEAKGDRNGMLKTYVDIFQQLMGPDGTIVTPTFTYVRQGPGSPYIHESSQSETGILTEHVRKMDSSLRSLHPVFSFAAIGKEKERICLNTSHHSYAINTPTYRLYELDALVIGIGRSPHRGTFFIHLGEILVGVPYRYVKELDIPVFYGGKQVNSPFYHYVKYSDSDIEWDTNRLVERLESRRMVKYEMLGRNGIWAFQARDVVNETVNLLMRNTYGLLSHPPVRKPWTK